MHNKKSMGCCHSFNYINLQDKIILILSRKRITQINYSYKGQKNKHEGKNKPGVKENKPGVKENRSITIKADQIKET